MEAEAQRGEVTCQQSHSQQEEEAGFEPKYLVLKPNLFNHSFKPWGGRGSATWAGPSQIRPWRLGLGGVGAGGGLCDSERKESSMEGLLAVGGKDTDQWQGLASGEEMDWEPIDVA